MLRYLDIELTIECNSHSDQWHVSLRSDHPGLSTVKVSEWVHPLADDIVAALPEMPDPASGRRTWNWMVRQLGPGRSHRLSVPMLRSLGSCIRSHLLGPHTIAIWFARAEARAEQEGLPICLLLQTLNAPGDLLSRIPLELAFDGQHYLLKRDKRLGLRLPQGFGQSYTEIQAGARALVVTAHREGEAPSAGELKLHAEAIADHMRVAGWLPELLLEATPSQLEARLLETRPALLYVACHGEPDSDNAGILKLRPDPEGRQEISGVVLSGLFDRLRQNDHPAHLVILCACSTAMVGQVSSTSNMAERLVQEGGVHYAIGFRGPVAVDWALKFTGNILAFLARSPDPVAAFNQARLEADEADAQWVLPLMYGQKPQRDGATIVPATSSTRPAVGQTEAVSATWRPSWPGPRTLPSRPRDYFTGRAQELKTLERLLAKSGTVALAALGGAGGIGKTELARKLFWTLEAQGRSVLWLGMAGTSVVQAQLELIRTRVPGFEPAVGATAEALSTEVQRCWSHVPGLLILDDVSEAGVVDLLRPGPDWTVLVTTRNERLLPGASVVSVGPLLPDDALRLLSRLAWENETPPVEEGTDARALVEALGRIPKALELAGRTLYSTPGLSCEAYLEEWRGYLAGAAKDRAEVVGSLLRSLSGCTTEEEALFWCLGLFPSAGMDAKTLAMACGQPEGRVPGRLARLVRERLVERAEDGRRYGLHPLLREEVQLRSRQAPAAPGVFTAEAEAEAAPPPPPPPP